MKLRSWVLVVFVALAAASTAVTSGQHLISSVDQDSDADGLPDRWESQVGLDSRSGAGPDGAAGDPDGDGLTNAQEYEAGTHPRGFHATYLPEAGAGSMAARVALLNPDSQPASVLLTFATADGERVRRMLQLGPTSRLTLGPDALADVRWTEFGTTIESDRRVVVDRTFSDDGVAYSSHGQTSGAAASRTWFIADGDTTGGTNLFYIIQNGQPAAADVEVQDLLPAPQLPLTKIYRVEAHSRSAVWVNAEARTDRALAALSSSGVSAAITSSVPVVVERAMYRGGVDCLARAGHGVLGMTAAAPHWFFAGGATGPAVDMFLTIVNPDAAAALVDAEYRLDSGEVVVRHYTIPGSSRSRILVDDEDPRLARTPVAATLTSINGVAVVAERSMQVAASAGGIAEMHHGTGGGTATRWGIADGRGWRPGRRPDHHHHYQHGAVGRGHPGHALLRRRDHVPGHVRPGRRSPVLPGRSGALPVRGWTAVRHRD